MSAVAPMQGLPPAVQSMRAPIPNPEPMAPAKSFTTFLNGLSEFGWGLTAAVCEHYNVLLSTTSANDTHLLVNSWGLPVGSFWRVVIGSTGYQFGSAVLRTTTIVTATATGRGIIALMSNGPADAEATLQSTAGFAIQFIAGLGATYLFQPLTMSFDRYIVTGKWPSWLTSDEEKAAEPYDSRVIREAMAVSLTNDFLAVWVLPTAISSVLGDGPFAALCNWATPNILLRPIRAVMFVMSVEGLPFTSALSLVRNDFPTSDDSFWIAKIPPPFRIMPVELSISVLMAGVDIFTGLTVGLLDTLV